MTLTRSTRKSSTPSPAWLRIPAKRCAVCGTGRGRAHRHHLVTWQVVRRWGGERWDPRNCLVVCEGCHTDHHSRRRPIPLRVVPTAAREFAAELMGANRADLYWGRFYAAGEE